MPDLEARVKDIHTAPDRKEDPLGFYRAHYNGVTRWRLKLLDSGLYNILWEGGLLQHVPVCRVQKKRKNYGEDLLQYYREHYAGLTRTRLGVVDSALYQRLRRAKLLGDIPLTYRSFGNDPLGYYERNYHGLTQGQLRKRDTSLYQTLWRTNLLDNVPKQ